jgi:hypothetical protein
MAGYPGTGLHAIEEKVNRQNDWRLQILDFRLTSGAAKSEISSQQPG